MVPKRVILLLLFFNSVMAAQLPPLTAEYEAQPVGGKEQLEQVLQTQLNLPKDFVSKGFTADIITYFNIDSSGAATRVKFESGADKILYDEVKRILHFLKFTNTLNLPLEPNPYFLIFKLSSEKYRKYQKQRSKYAVKIVLPADSTYIIHTKADRSPEYYKNGDEGLKDYFSDNMEYPKVATENLSRAR